MPNPKDSSEEAQNFEIVTAPMPLSLDAVHKILQRDELKPFDRMILVRRELRALGQQRKLQIEGVLQVEQAKIDMNVAVAKKAVAAHQETLVLHIRERFVQTARELGSRVELSQLDFLTDFGEDITKRLQALEGRNLTEQIKQTINQKGLQAFFRTVEKLDELADGLMKDAARKHG